MKRMAICDNKHDTAQWLEGIVRDAYDFDISVYNSSKDLATDISKGIVYELYILEVDTKPLDGIEIARLIRERDSMAAIVYLTGNERRALDAFSVRASQYLIKPVSGDVLRGEIDAALKTMKARKAGTFLLKTRDGIKSIPLFKIVYCRVKGRVLCCKTSDGEEYMSVTTRTSFEEVTAKLLGDRRFFRCHLSYVVNMEYVGCIKGSLLELKNGGTVPISRSRRAELREKYMNYAEDSQ